MGRRNRTRKGGNVLTHHRGRQRPELRGAARRRRGVQGRGWSHRRGARNAIGTTLFWQNMRDVSGVIRVWE